MKRANIRFNVNKLFYSYTQFEIMTGQFGSIRNNDRKTFPLLFRIEYMNKIIY